MRIFITGISGLLGINTAHICHGRHEVSGCYHRHPVALPGAYVFGADLEDPRSLDDEVRRIAPEMIVHTAGLTNVDVCEEQPRRAQHLNVDAAAHVALLAQAVDATLVHISTDHLFDGSRPLRTEADVPAPVNVYASTKWQAEQTVRAACPRSLVIRTNFYGWGPPTRASFSDWILAGLRAGQEVRMFHDIYFTPILVNDLVEAMLRLVGQGASGVVHVAGGQRLSKHAFGLTLADVFGFPPALIRTVGVEEVSLRARRPRDMSLDTRRAAELIGEPLPDAVTGMRRLRRLQEEGWPARLASSFQGLAAESVRRGRGR